MSWNSRMTQKWNLLTINRIKVRVTNDGTINLYLLTRFCNDFASDLHESEAENFAEIAVNDDKVSESSEEELSSAQSEIYCGFVQFCFVNHLSVSF